MLCAVVNLASTMDSSVSRLDSLENTLDLLVCTEARYRQTTVTWANTTDSLENILGCSANSLD